MQTNKQMERPGKTELTIIDLLVQCKTNREIADSLGLSKSTLENRLNELYERYEVKCKAGLCYKAGTNRWLQDTNK
ncbi:MAG: LuxR C-terminal-related transcriptional regulator [Bacteroidota bacterium]